MTESASEEWSVLESSPVNLDFGSVSLQGQGRFHNEDRQCCFEGVPSCGGLRGFAVFDGHGGDEASQFAASVLPFETESAWAGGDLEVMAEEVFVEIDRKFIAADRQQRSDAGACACVVFVLGRHLVAANAGDCRAISVAIDGDGFRVKELTRDHRSGTPAGAEYIERLGGMVEAGRLFGSLEPCRGFGDLNIREEHEEHLKKMSDEWVEELGPEKQLPTPVPEITHAVLLDSGPQEAVIIASDGVWSVLSSNVVGALVASLLLPPKKTSQGGGKGGGVKAKGGAKDGSGSLEQSEVSPEFRKIWDRIVAERRRSCSSRAALAADCVASMAQALQSDATDDDTTAVVFVAS
uniref:protein-serine/threonine phosphatase n=1 Tax=Chromera velia CCMP2878 TaxID=1169474 RepID=A0A0G4IA40_9ALVE|eukprot:Cvel_12447.t1-p1 / transcript=Cvel_12447.t1 / gene=Cvel_12447 / organism=Chromera_velia_CCMP2878 / gene_product=Protein phosphatase 2C homolog 3, putative / transcript_product=Protein phosphatase 2C homolog 3, putative / location=Cvel_scaffold815:20323-21372(-) / protein_length=350 / sequence_SO=supercontig / SO=protein_coding / is_pseudo=false